MDRRTARRARQAQKQTAEVVEGYVGPPPSAGSSSPSASSSAPTVGLVVRANAIEAPFLNEFIDYHLRLGVRRIYLVNTEQRPERRDFCKHIAPALRVSVEEILYLDLGPAWQRRSIAAAVNVCAEDWVLSVDVDEFLWLRGQTLQEFVATLAPEVAAVEFQWLLCPSAQRHHSSVLSQLDSCALRPRCHCKSLAKRDAIERVKNPHHFFLHYGKVRRCSNYATEPFVLHFCSRGIDDVLNKLSEQKIKHGQKHSADALARSLHGQSPYWRMPFRFVLLLIQMSMPTLELPALSVPRSPYGTQLPLLAQITRESCAKARVAYEDYLAVDIEHRFELLRQELPPLQLDMQPNPWPAEVMRNDFYRITQQMIDAGKLRHRNQRRRPQRAKAQTR